MMTLESGRRDLGFRHNVSAHPRPPQRPGDVALGCPVSRHAKKKPSRVVMELEERRRRLAPWSRTRASLVMEVELNCPGTLVPTLPANPVSLRPQLARRLQTTEEKGAMDESLVTTEEAQPSGWNWTIRPTADIHGEVLRDTTVLWLNILF
jgi:hypothetical protein